MTARSITMEEMLALSEKEFAEAFKDGTIHQSSYEILGLTEVDASQE